jgi:ABC-type multidrug transport system fused ATPase/permease subunit
VNLTTAIGTAVVLGYSRMACSRELTVGHLLVVMAYIAAVYKPLEAITYALGSIQDKVVHQRVAFNLLDTVPEVQESANAVGRLVPVCWIRGCASTTRDVRHAAADHLQN